uniref:Uncharacterized protein n=1 Tax=Arundo donax TaxID=35708 RepID=A0A0A9BY70_ARUDO
MHSFNMDTSYSVTVYGDSCNFYICGVNCRRCKTLH